MQAKSFQIPINSESIQLPHHPQYFGKGELCGLKSSVWLSPQIRLLYGIKSKAAISLTLDLHCKAIAALFSIP